MNQDLRGAIDDPGLRAQLPAAELVELLLARIAETHQAINAYITVDADGARAAAQATDARRARGETLGPLDGMPLGIKDNIDVAGLLSTRGSAFFADRIATEDAEVIRRLRAAGAIIVGKVQLHEFAFGATTDNLHFGACRNPWDRERVPGGSSGGSGAALGADLCIGALGTDTGGSVRIPAALNNVSALRPTFGLVSTRGTFPVSALFDTIGPMARAMRDVAHLFAVIAGYDRDDPNGVDHPYADPLATLGDGVAGLRIGVPRRFFFEDLDPSVARSTEEAAEQLAALGAEVFDVELEGAEEAFAITNVLVKAEATGVHRERIDTDPGRFDPDVLRRLRLGDEIGAPAVGRALEQMRAWRVRMLQAFDGVDLLLTPTTNAPAPRLGADDMIEMTARLTRFTYSWSLAGMPAVSVPARPHENGMPLGVQLGAAPWNDATALRAGHAFQQATDWHLRRPPGLA
ncbi:amidase [Baekduia soli]|uniref:Amidase n=1 Tax=Baekduia soli TaxID=496014 RepID=A0A5B8U5N5_9ACTN|nr:amidase [Baekduia soli]QEC48436.1 amidase [Baekduia soli]